MTNVESLCGLAVEEACTMVVMLWATAKELPVLLLRCRELAWIDIKDDTWPDVWSDSSDSRRV